MSIETVDDIIQEIADITGIYNSHIEGELNPCRCCFITNITSRLEEAFRIQFTLEKHSDVKLNLIHK